MTRSRAGAALAMLAAACGSKAREQHDAGPPPAADAARLSPRDAAVPLPKPARAERTAWELVDNRHTAYRAVDSELVIDARGIGFARFIHYNLPVERWHLGQLVDGEHAAIAERLAALELPVSIDQTSATQLTAHVHGQAKQVLALKVNGRTAGRGARVALAPGWQTVTLHIDRGRLVPGDNQLVFETSGGKGEVAFAWLRLGAAKPVGTDDPLAAAGFDAKPRALELAANAQLAWFATIPDGAQLVVDSVTPGCRVDVVARAGDASFAGGLLASDHLRVDLTPIAGKVVRLALTARDCARARVVHPRITLAGPDPAPLPAADAPRFVVLWLMTGLRADRHPALVNFDEIAKSSSVFRQFYVQGVGSGLPLIERQLAQAGYFTLGFTRSATSDAALAELDKHRTEPTAVMLVTPVAPQCTPAAYDSGVVAADLQLGRFVHQLQAWGIWDQTLLIVTSDRGEQLTPDGRCARSTLLAAPLLHVPLLIHDPARFPGGAIVDDGTEYIDVLPSILAALGKPLGDVQGAPLEPLAQGIGRGWPRPTYATSAEHAHVLQIGRWKIRVTRDGVATVGDLVADPDDSRDVTAERPVERRMLEDHLGLFLALRNAWRKSAWGVVTNVTAEGAAALDDASTP